MAFKHKKIYSTSLITREMQIKSVFQIQFILWSKIKESNNTLGWRGYREAWALIQGWCLYKSV